MKIQKSKFENSEMTNCKFGIRSLDLGKLNCRKFSKTVLEKLEVQNSEIRIPKLKNENFKIEASEFENSEIVAILKF